MFRLALTVAVLVEVLIGEATSRLTRRRHGIGSATDDTPPGAELN